MMIFHGICRLLPLRQPSGESYKSHRRRTRKWQRKGDGRGPGAEWTLESLRLEDSLLQLFSAI